MSASISCRDDWEREAMALAINMCRYRGMPHAVADANALLQHLQLGHEVSLSDVLVRGTVILDRSTREWVQRIGAHVEYSGGSWHLVREGVTLTFGCETPERAVAAVFQEFDELQTRLLALLKVSNRGAAAEASHAEVMGYPPNVLGAPAAHMPDDVREIRRRLRVIDPKACVYEGFGGPMP